MTMALIRSMDNVGVSQWPVAKTLGLTNRQVIKKVLIPNITPWYFASAMIITMEVISDFGGVSIFNYDTLSTAIYTAWTGLFSYNLAIKLALILIFISMVLFAAESKVKGRKSYNAIKMNTYMSHPPIHLNKNQQILLHLPILIYFALSLLVPFFFLISWSITSDLKTHSNILNLAKDTIFLGILLAFMTTLVGFLYSYLSRGKHQLIKSLELMGYSLPGTIVAISFIGLVSIYNSNFNQNLTITNMTLLFFALLYRHIFISDRNWSSNFNLVNSATENSAKIFGLSTFQRIKLSYYPIWKENYLPITTLLFIEIIKELPITLMLRPFGLNTLSIKIYELTTEGYWEEAGIYALGLMLIGMPLSFYAFNREKE